MFVTTTITTVKWYLDLRDAIVKAGFEQDIEWGENIKPCTDPLEF